MESLDTFRTVAFAADFASERLPPATLSGGDYRGRVLRLSLTDGGQPTEAEGVLCRLGWNADPGQDLGSFVEASRVDGTDTATWEVEVPTSMLAQPRCKAAWMLYTAGTANVLCTLAFDVAVERPVVDAASAEGEDLVDRLWTAIDTMEAATDNANAATESAHKAADAAAEAAAMAQMGTNRLTAEATGELVNVSDAFPGTLLETRVFGRSEQVTTTGKNLLEVTGIGRSANTLSTSFTSDGVSWTIESDGAVSAKGTATAKTYCYFNAIELPTGTYTASGCRILNKPLTFTITTTETVTPYIEIEAGTSVGATHRVQLELGSTATAYEPYSGGVPSPSPEWPQPIESVSSAEVVTAGKNLVASRVSPGSSSTVNGVTFRVNEDGSVTLSGTSGASRATLYLMGTWGARGNFAAIAGLDLFLSDTGSTYSDVAAYGFEDGSYKTGVYSGSRFGDAFKYADGLAIAIEVPASTTVGETVRIMLNEGATALPWSVPGTTHPLDLQGHELRSLPDGTRDELVVNADGSYGIVQRVGHYVFDGSADEPWNASSAYSGAFWIYPSNTVGDSRFGVPYYHGGEHFIRSSAFKPMGLADYQSSKVGIFSDTSLCIQSGGVATTLAEWREWLAANPVEVDWKMAITGTDTPSEVYIPLGTLDPAPAWPDEGVNNAWTVSDLPTETGVGYVQSVQIVHDRQEARLAALETAIATLEA